MPMRLEANQVSDMVEVERLRRRFHALVAGHASGGPSIQPLELTLVEPERSREDARDADHESEPAWMSVPVRRKP
jgi:hypothetical protein